MPPDPADPELNAAMPDGLGRALARRAVDVLGEAVTRADGWFSAMMGFGTSADKMASMVFDPRISFLDAATLRAMYLTDAVAARIVDLYPREAMREGFELGGLDPESEARASGLYVEQRDAEKRQDHESAFSKWRARTDAKRKRRADAQDSERAVYRFLDGYGVGPKVLDFVIWARLFGGRTGIWIGSRTADQATPFRLGEQVDFIRGVDKRYLWPEVGSAESFDDEGRPLVYSLSLPDAQGNPIRPGAGYVPRIHASRLVLFPGARTDVLTHQQLNYSDTSVLQKALSSLKADGAMWGASQNLATEASIGVLAIKNLFALVSAGQKDKLATRMQMHNMSRSITRSMLLDADKESYTRVPTTFSGLSDLNQEARERIAADAEIPMTIFNSQAPGGLNSTGDSDLRWWLMRVAGYRCDEIEPGLLYIVKALLAQPSSPARNVEDLTIMWPAL